MQNGPLLRIMFPTYSTMSLADRNVITQWYTDGLEEALEGQGDHTFLKACQHTDNGADGILALPVGFCGCEVIERSRRYDATNQQQTVDESGCSAQPGEKEAYNSGSSTRRREWGAVPETLDVDGWLALSERLRMERQRVLKGLDSVCRLTFMAVHPDFQRQGIGSMMLERLCDETDRCRGRSAYVLAAAEGVPLYSRFGFGVIGQVDTPHGSIMRCSGRLVSVMQLFDQSEIAPGCHCGIVSDHSS